MVAFHSYVSLPEGNYWHIVVIYVFFSRQVTPITMVYDTQIPMELDGSYYKYLQGGAPKIAKLVYNSNN